MTEDSFEVNQVNPKFGVQWNVIDALRFRGAVFRTLKPALVNSRTLEPTQIAGFNQFFDDLNATKSWRYGAGLDWQMTKDIFAGAELTWRELDEPVLVFADPFDEFQGRNNSSRATSSCIVAICIGPRCHR